MKFLAAVIIICLSFVAHAQEYQKLRAGVGLGFAAACVEASYRLNDNMLVGIRGETAYSISSIGSTRNHWIGSQSIFYQYYFKSFQHRFRPFVGAGIGLYKPGISANASTGPIQDQTWSTETQPGFFPRVGFDYRHFTLTLDSNWAPSSKAIVGNTLSPGDPNYHAPHIEYLTNNYLALKIGVFFGGGRKN